MKSKAIHRKHTARRRPLGQALSPRLLRAGPAPWEGNEPSPAGPPSSGRRPAGRVHRGPEARAPGAPAAATLSPPQNKSAHRRTPSPARRRLDSRCPQPSQDQRRCASAGREPSPPTPNSPTGTQPSQGERRKTQRLAAPEFISQLGSASRGGPSWRPRSRNSTTPPRAQRQLRDPVPGAGVLVPIG